MTGEIAIEVFRAKQGKRKYFFTSDGSNPDEACFSSQNEETGFGDRSSFYLSLYLLAHIKNGDQR